MKGPFPEARFVATGGITPAEAGNYLTAGADIVGMGSSITSPATLRALSPLLQQPGNPT